jgi:hypothetical protein
MEKKINYGNVFFRLASILLFLIVISLSFRTCQMKKEYSQAVDQILYLETDKKGIEKLIDEKGREVSSLRASVLVRDKKIEKQLKEIEQLKNLDSKIIVDTRTIIDTQIISLHDTTYIEKTDTIKIQKFDYEEKWFSIKGKVKKSELLIDSLKIVNQYTIEVGDEKVNMFKKQKKVYVRNENPYTQTQNMKAFILEDKQKWYERDILKVVATAIGTAFILRNF